MLFRYISREILLTSLFVLVALLALFGFFDLIHELDDLGKGSYRLPAMLSYVTLSLASHAYVLLPAAGLIGTLFALARMSEHSEITVMRASGMSLGQLGVYVSGAGIVIALVTAAMGEGVTPYTEEWAKDLRLKATQSIVAREFRSGFWVKDERSFVNIQDVTPDTTLLNLKIYEFDPAFRLTAISRAEKGTYEGPNKWQLTNVELTRFEGDRAVLQHVAKATWNSVLTPDILAVLKIVPERMSAVNLRAYIDHLRENRQKATRYEIALWNKLLYPLVAIMLMVMAIPFAVQSARAGGVGLKLVLGIMIGLLFHFAGRLFSHVGLLNDWPPMISAGLPLAYRGAGGVRGTRGTRRAALRDAPAAASSRAPRWRCRQGDRGGIGGRGRRAPTRSPRPSRRAEQSEHIAMQRAARTGPRALGAHEADAPRLHGERLAAARPEPHVVGADRGQHPNLQDVAPPAVRGIAEQGEEREGDDDRERDGEQQVVEGRCEAPRDRRRARRGCRAHRDFGPWPWRWSQRSRSSCCFSGGSRRMPWKAWRAAERCSGVMAAQVRMRSSKRCFWMGCRFGYWRAAPSRRCCWKPGIWSQSGAMGPRMRC